jgi:hypothetical protein
MAKDIFGSLPSNIPKSDSRIIRVDMAEQEMGARKAHLPKVSKNNQPIVHVGRGS